MSPPVQLVPDIWDLIVDILGDGLHYEASYSALQNLALTCKAMVEPCRRHLFSTINLEIYSSWDVASKLARLIRRFHKLVTDNPEIIDYIRHFQHYILFSQEARVHQIFEMLCKSTTLRSIKIQDHTYKSQWDAFPKALQTPLERLIRLPSVTTVNLKGIAAIPPSIFIGCTSLTHLTLNYVGFTHHNDSDTDVTQHDVSESPRPIYLHMLLSSPRDVTPLMYPNQRIIDFSGLAALEFEVNSNECMEVIWQVLKLNRRVESLSITATSCMNDPISWTGFGGSLSAGSVGALDDLTLRLEVVPDYDPLDVLVTELTMIAGINIIDQVLLEVKDCSGDEPRGGKDIWSAIDALFTTPGSFPMLDFVTVQILWADDYEERDANFFPLTEECFPRLLDSELIEFEFSSKQM